MKTIVLVCDDVNDHGNGTSNSARQFAEELQRRGFEVRLVGIGAPEFSVREQQIFSNGANPRFTEVQAPDRAKGKSDSELSAASQFSLHQRLLFAAGNAQQLAQKIDW